MTLTPSTATVCPFVKPRLARAVPVPATLRPLPFAHDHRLAAHRRQRRTSVSGVPLYCDGIETIVLATLTWLASLVLTGLVHGTVVDPGGDPHLSGTLVESGAPETQPHLTTVQEVSK